MRNEIKIAQYPIITHQLKEAGKNVTKRIADLELDKVIATTDTIKTLKDLRTELNKELADLELQRKVIKEGVNKPYLEFEALYEVEISEKYKSAIGLLKDKISTVEDKIKREKKDAVEVYFNELCISEKIDFITFDKLELEINLSTSEKKYKEKVYDFISKITDDLSLIKSIDHPAETLAEYKITLNASKSITTIKTRKEAEAAEEARLKAEETKNRKKSLTDLGLNYIEITNNYEFNEDIYLSLGDINNLTKENFAAKYAEIEIKINDIKAEQIPEQPVKSIPIANLPKKVINRPTISAPVIQSTPEELKTASFTVTATLKKLRALGEYMKENGITYINI